MNKASPKGPALPSQFLAMETNNRSWSHVALAQQPWTPQSTLPNWMHQDMQLHTQLHGGALQHTAAVAFINSNHTIILAQKK